MSDHTGTEIASLAGKGLRGEMLTEAEIKSVCASALVQHDKHGPASAAAVALKKANPPKA